VKKTLLRQSTFATKKTLQAPEEVIITFLAQQIQQQVRKYLARNQVACAIKLLHYPFKQTTGIGNNSQ
jgi:hypothetical protein